MYHKLNFSYNREFLLKEIFQHEQEFVDIPASAEYLKFRPFDIVDTALYEQVTTVSMSGVIKKGSVPSWRGYSFTHIPNNSLSSYGSNSLRFKPEQWVWKDNSNCKYLKSLIEELGFIEIQNIRAMIIEPTGFGPVHCDVPPNIDYYKNHTSVTFNLEDGGQPLIAKIQDNMYEFNDPCFIFQDNCWHGVGIVSSRRTQLRINGKVDSTILKKYIDVTGEQHGFFPT